MNVAVSDEKWCKNCLLIMAPPLAHYQRIGMEGLATLKASFTRDRTWNNLPRDGHHLTVYPRHTSYTIVSMGIASLVSCVPISTNVTCAISRSQRLISKSPKEASEPGLIQTVLFALLIQLSSVILN